MRILIADDHALFRDGLRSLLGTQGHEVIAEARNGREAIDLTKKLTPDLVLMDISMPEMDGLTATRTLTAEMPDVKVLILSVHSNKEYIFRIIQAGAHGYVSKEAKPEELLRAIESVYSGEPFFSEDIARAALNQFVTRGGQKEPFNDLTSRERQVLVLIAEGQSNKQIAHQLGIGVRTIETHRERIMRRLDIHSVAGLTKYAIANGLVPMEDGQVP